MVAGMVAEMTSTGIPTTAAVLAAVLALACRPRRRYTQGGTS